MKKSVRKVLFTIFLIVLFSVGHSAYAAITLHGATNVSNVFNTTIDGGTGLDRTIIYAGAGDTTDNITSVTWNGEDFTKVLTQHFPAIGRYNYVWCLTPSGTGTHTFIANGISGSSAMTVMVYKGAGDCKNASSTSGTGTSGSISLSASNGDWLVGGGGNDVGTISMGSNTTARGLTGSSQGQADSNGASSPTALNFSVPSSNWAAYGVVISPQTTPDPTNRIMKYITESTSGPALLFDNGVNTILTSGNFLLQASSSIDTAFAGILNIGTATTTAISIGRTNATTTFAGPLKAADIEITSLKTTSNCASTSSPASCGGAPAGSVAFSVGATTLVVNTTAVTANSQIFVIEDSSLGTRLGVTCSTTLGRIYTISNRTAGTSFTIKSDAPVSIACLNYFIVN